MPPSRPEGQISTLRNGRRSTDWDSLSGLIRAAGTCGASRRQQRTGAPATGCLDLVPDRLARIDQQGVAAYSAAPAARSASATPVIVTKRPRRNMSRLDAGSRADLGEKLKLT
jgi:hypothetical protein